MTSANDPHTREKETVHIVEKSGGGSSALWLILGAVIAGLAIWFFVLNGAPADDTTYVTITGGAAEAVQGAAEAVEGAATAVEGAAEGN
ncbi:hypothetical protein JANAI62_01010 [Jannaschia pagri]|uniref:Uncharacterized protein n=1 Tax=Jannaschia pagri TaxID=2829797 RepID=A0ABQ4NGC7_9RHOB|nr:MULTISPECIES: hypothetical protein [unclassified Jannaschia]GIT90417.1 hypothetical protein JANAI61_08750 [Jannaschia sp. AI_61]GIT93478.1 hypothetical protein JANAI62_01010 [Jannaschia sp. AI_62]